MTNIVVTPVAEAHFKALIDKEEVEKMALRVFLDAPGAPNAEVGITFCPPGEEKETDVCYHLDSFSFYVDEKSLGFLEEAKIDYKTDALGGELSITAPHLRGKKPQTEAPLLERVKYVLNTEVNPHLAQHGGVVKLVELTADNVAVLSFGGGCQGCGMVDVTLKDGIEKTLLSQVPELSGVRDVTDHSSGDNPYY